LSYTVWLHPKARQSRERLREAQRKRIVNRLKELETDPKKGKLLKLGRFYSLRIGDYRAIYEVWEDQGKVVVLHIGHRRGVYDEFIRWI